MMQNLSGSNMGLSVRRLKNSLCQPSSKVVPVPNQGRINAEKRGIGSDFPKIQ